MSYASRLAAMSRGHVPAAPPRVVGGDAEPPREEAVEAAVPAAPPTQVDADAPSPERATPPPVSSTAPLRVSPAPHEVPDEAPRKREPTSVVATRETIERHTVVEAAIPAAPPLARVALPPQAQWLGEDERAPDPLVANADTDALRELMRNVRQWTASAPVVIEQPEVAAEPPSAAPAAAVPVAPTQISIGNVTITVDDAPTPARTRTTQSQHSESDRMARNYIRGG